MKAVADCTQMAELIPPFAEGSLPAGEKRAVEDHLRACAKCRRALGSFTQLQSFAKATLTPGVIGQNFNAETGERLKAVTTGPQLEVEEGEEIVAPAAEGFFDSLSQRFGAAPWWMISGSFHGLLILLLFLIGMAIMQAKKNDTVILTSLEKKKEPDPPKDPEREIFQNPVPVVMPETEAVETPVVVHEEVEISDHEETDDNMDSHDAFGDEGISDIPLGGSGVSGAIGVGGGGAGAFGRPLGGGRARLARAMRGGGSKATESAVDKALEWLARHQEADGSWSVRKTEGAGDWDPGVTGLAVLAFLGAGHTEKVGKYKDNVSRAIDWIIANQRDDGAIGTNGKFTEHHGGYGYHHAICGMALAEASAMGRVPRTKEAAQKAIEYSCDKYQHGEGSDKLGWRYKPKANPADLSVSGWYIMQLKSAKVAGLSPDPASFEGGIKFLDSRMVSKEKVKVNPDASYDSGLHRYGYTDNQKAMVNTTSIGILCRLYLGTKPEEVEGAAAWLLQTNPPAWREDLGVANGGGWPMYYMYYTTLTMFQVGGDLWKQWNEGLKATLLNNQRKGGDEDGSWDPLSPWEKKAGRAYTTALGAMCLEVYYRYMPLYRGN